MNFCRTLQFSRSGHCYDTRTTSELIIIFQDTQQGLEVPHNQLKVANVFNFCQSSCCNMAARPQFEASSQPSNSLRTTQFSYPDRQALLSFLILKFYRGLIFLSDLVRKMCFLAIFEKSASFGTILLRGVIFYKEKYACARAGSISCLRGQRRKAEREQFAKISKPRLFFGGMQDAEISNSVCNDLDPTVYK